MWTALCEEGGVVDRAGRPSQDVSGQRKKGEGGRRSGTARDLVILAQSSKEGGLAQRLQQGSSRLSTAFFKTSFRGLERWLSG